MLPDELRELATRVPREPGTELPGGASSAEIDAAEASLGVQIPPEVREWLAFTNGPAIGPGGVYGLAEFEEVYGFIPEFRANRWLPLGTDGCGNYFVLATDSSPLRPVFFVDGLQDGGYGVPTYAVASHYWRFLRFLLQRELGETRWPFERDYVTEWDLDFESITGATLPWDA